MISQTVAPSSDEEVSVAIRDAGSSGHAVYPVGGGTSLDFGLPARRQGVALRLEQLNQVIDYPARDLTITAQAGVTMKQLAEVLGAERQQFPIDVPQPERATLGGVVATNWNGSRRYGLGSVRDYVLGISAVDGRGMPFRAGGRVVKNVAGYDFCKLLTGSLGTLGVITQITLKVKPAPQQSMLRVCPVRDLAQAEQLLAELVHSQTAPVAIELLGGPEWGADDLVGDFYRSEQASLLLVVGLEGTESEVAWMNRQLEQEWIGQGLVRQLEVTDAQATELWRRLAAFPQSSESPLVIKAAVVPSGTTSIIEVVRELDADCSIQAHAGNGLVIVKFSEFPTEGLSRSLLSRLQPAASRAHGHVVILSNPGGTEMTRRSVWGGTDLPYELLTEIKRQFDPHDVLNPERFVY